MHKLSILLLLSFSALVIASSNQKAIFDGSHGVAINGYDVVHYFNLHNKGDLEGEALKGSHKYKATHKGFTFHFVSQKNLETFLSNKEKYAPKFGGYCAYAVGNGYTAGADPDAWSIVDDKLYLNYNKSVRERWNANQANYIRSGNKNWPGVLN